MSKFLKNSEMTTKIKYDLLPWTSAKVEGFSGKNLLDITNGGVKIVKIIPFAKYPIHVHPDKIEFAYVIKGHLKMTIGDGTFDGKEGDFFVFPKAMKHSIESHSKAESILLVGAIKN